VFIWPQVQRTRLGARALSQPPDSGLSQRVATDAQTTSGPAVAKPGASLFESLLLVVVRRNQAQHRAAQPVTDANLADGVLAACR